MIRKHFWKIFFAFSVIGLSAMVATTWHIEEIDEFAKNEIRKFSEKNLPFQIIPERIELKLIPLQAIIYKTQIKPQGELNSNLRPFVIEVVTIRPSLIHLLIGKIHIAKVEINGLKVQYKKTLLPSQQEFKIELEKTLSQIPITQITVDNLSAHVDIQSENRHFSSQISSASLVLTNDVSNLLVKMKAEKISGQYNGTQVLKHSFFETHFFLTEKNLVLSDLKFKENESYLVASGSTQHSLRKKLIKGGNLNIRCLIDDVAIKHFYSVLNIHENKDLINNTGGHIKSDLRLHFKKESFDIESTTRLQKLRYEKFHIGDIEAVTFYDHSSKSLNIKSLHIENDGLDASLANAKVDLQNLNVAKSSVTIKHLYLQKYLNYAIKKNIPADAQASGNIDCSGQLDPLKLVCSTQMTTNNIIINPKPELPIFKYTDLIKIQGQAEISATDISYNGKIDMGHSHGESDGVINYKKGFSINYSTPALDLGKIQKISVLNVSGITKISGRSSGNSEAATFDFQMDGKNLNMQKYKLGDLSSTVNYKSGLLSVDRIQGTLSSSRYLGELKIDLAQDLLRGRVQFPFIDLAVTQDAISENLKLPIAINGTGAAVVNIDGPLNPKQLSFKAKARLYNSKLDQQHIETAEIELLSHLGVVEFKNVVLEEKNSVVKLGGSLNLEKESYDLNFDSQQIILDDIYYVKKQATPARGTFQMSGHVKGYFSNPIVDVKFISENFLVANKRLAPLSGNVSYQKQKVLAEILGPNNFKFLFRNIDSLPDYQIEGNTKKFDVSSFITSLLQLEMVDDFKVYLTSDFNFKISKNDFTKINGYLFLPEIELQADKNILKSSKDISLFFSSGKINFSAFQLEGSGGKINFKSNSTSSSDLDLQMSGIFNLSFARIFTPFLETLEGNTTVNFRIQKEREHLYFFGSAFIDDGFAKIEDIQHAVENLKIDVLFNQDRININSLKGKFASGELTGDGAIRLIGKKNIPIDLRIHLENIDLNLPAQINTVGTADLRVTGQWLPLTLSGKYEVVDGLISKEFGGGDVNKKSAHDIFLPQALRQQKESPINLNVDIHPIYPLKIKNSMIDGKIQGNIHVAGDPQNPLLNGNIQITRQSQLIFRDVIFRVRDSNIHLNNTLPPNPELYLLADSRYKGYDIEMQIQGPADKPKIILTSQPTLTQPEIISLLALGYTTNETTNTNSGINNQGLQVGTGVFGNNPLGREFKNRFGVDVQFSSRFDSTSSVAVPTIGFSKQISERTSFVGSVQTGRESNANGKLRYELDRGFSATMSIQSQAREENNQLQGNRATDILGIDLEFRKEFK